MVKHWQMTELSSPVPLPSNRRDNSSKGPLHRIGSFYLAILLLFLTACVHLLHTCTPHWLFSLDPLSPSINGSGCFNDLREAPAGSPCLACLFLHSLSTAKVAVLTLALSWLIIFRNILAYQRFSFTTNAAGPCFIRGPPGGGFVR
jgi:hypothetical protein